MRNKVLEALCDEGIFLAPEAADFVLNQENPLGYVRTAMESMPQLPLVITLQDALSPAEKA